MIEPTSLGAGQTVRAALSFEDFFITEHERLFKALYMLTGNREEADDLAQEARWTHPLATCIERR
jgi:DNA-directed RNA polymerase specialized sigma24 family protein